MVQLRNLPIASVAAVSLLGHGVEKSCAFTTSRPLLTPKISSTILFGKKKKKSNTPGPNYKKKSGGGQPKQEKASVQEARFDAATRQFMFTLVGLTKTLPDKSKDILKNINLSFYPGAKIGVVGLNGSGKVRHVHHNFGALLNPLLR